MCNLRSGPLFVSVTNIWLLKIFPYYKATQKMQTLRGNPVDFHVHFTLRPKCINCALSLASILVQVVPAPMWIYGWNRDTDVHSNAGLILLTDSCIAVMNLDLIIINGCLSSDKVTLLPSFCKAIRIIVMKHITNALISMNKCQLEVRRPLQSTLRVIVYISFVRMRTNLHDLHNYSRSNFYMVLCVCIQENNS